MGGFEENHIQDQKKCVDTPRTHRSDGFDGNSDSDYAFMVEVMKMNYDKDLMETEYDDVVEILVNDLEYNRNNKDKFTESQFDRLNEMLLKNEKSGSTKNNEKQTLALCIEYLYYKKREYIWTVILFGGLVIDSISALVLVARFI